MEEEKLHRQIGREAKSFLDRIHEILTGYWISLVEAMPRILIALVVFLLILLIATQVSRIIKSRLRPKSHDPLLLVFIAKLIKGLMIVLAIILVLDIVGFKGVAGSLLAGAGIGAFIIGFAFKDIGENFLSGFLLAFKRPFRINDVIEVDSIVGVVQALNLRDTQIRTFNGDDVFIPNSIIVKQPLLNYTLQGISRLDFLVGIDYEDDIDKAIHLICEQISQVKGLPENKEPMVVIEELAKNSINLRVYFWVYSYEAKVGGMQVKTEVMKRVKNTLLDNGIVIPSNIQEIKLYSREKGFPVRITREDDGNSKQQ